MALHSFRHFISLSFKGLLHLKRERLGNIYTIKEKGSYRVFRETMNQEAMQEDPVVMVIGFRLKWIGSNPFFHWLFQRICIVTTPFWSGLPGFYVKLWMVDPGTKNYLGIYEWKGEVKARNYLNALIPVLHFVSVKGSVWDLTYPGRQLERVLAETASRQVMQGRVEMPD
jgi:hypothetical protein